jgi:hypothetical protein
MSTQQLMLHASNKTETVSQQADLMLQAATSHFQAILDALKRHDLEGLIPYMAELNVVKAVVRCVSFCRECRAARHGNLFACMQRHGAYHVVFSMLQAAI